MYPQRITAGDRIAQLIIQPYLNVDFNVVDELTDTERGSSGFGSTGMN
jgi:dUTP pyrophosphatase